MGRIFKWVGIVLAVLLLVVVSLPFLINANQFKPMLEAQLSSALNREVRLGDLKLSLWHGQLTADDLSVSEDPAFAKPAFIRAHSLRVGAELWPFLFLRKLIVTDLTIDSPEIALVQAPSGDWNFSSLGTARAKAPAAAAASPGSRPLDLSVKLVRIQDGKLTMGRKAGRWKPVVLQQVNLELRDFAADSAFPFTLSALVAGGGSIKLTGKAGPINPADAAMTPVNASLNIAQLDLAGSGMNDFAPNLAGILSLDGNLDSDGRALNVTSRIKIDRLKLAQKASAASRPVAFDLAAQHDLRKHSGTMRQGDFHVGSAVAHLTGSYAEQGDAMVLHFKLSGPGMPVEELETLLPALGVVLPSGSRLEGGHATVNLAMEGPADRLITTGSLALNNTKLTGFDLPKKMAVIERLAGIKGGPDTEIQNLSANVRVAPEGATAEDIRLIVPSLGDLSGGGAVSPSNELDFKMRASVHTAGFLAAVNDAPVPFTVQGTCADPVFRPDLKAVVAEEKKKLEQSAGKAAGSLLKGLLGGKK